MNGADALKEMLKTFEERNAKYKDNWNMAGRILAELHPNGITLKTAEEHAIYSVWEQLISKLTRFASSDLTHEDSIKDLGVYAAIITSIIQSEQPLTAEESNWVARNFSTKIAADEFLKIDKDKR